VFDLATLQPILNTAIDAVVVMDAEGLVVDWNTRAETIFGWTRDEVLGRRLGDIIVPPSLRDAHHAGLTRFLETGHNVVLGRLLELSAVRRDGSEFPVELSISTSGEAVDPLFLGFIRDISERRETIAKLEASEARFRAMADAAPAPVWMTTAEGGVEFVNEAFAEFAGLDREGLLGDVWIDLIHPDDILNVLSKRLDARAGLQSYSFEARFRRQSGVYKWMLANARPRIDAAGQFLGYLGMAMDLTEIKEAEAHQRLLIHELNHRVKNTLASIQSIARQTLKADETPPHVRERLFDRLLAMSAAHDVLTRENWSGAAVEEVVRQGLRPFVDERDPGRIMVQGPALRVGPSAALALSLAIHELGTNAVKYGALSTSEGKVSIDWTPTGGGRAQLVWREVGGPKVTEPARKGFGARLLDGGLTADLGGRPQLIFAPEGVEARLPLRLEV